MNARPEADKKCWGCGGRGGSPSAYMVGVWGGAVGSTIKTLLKECVAGGAFRIVQKLWRPIIF